MDFCTLRKPFHFNISRPEHNCQLYIQGYKGNSDHNYTENSGSDNKIGFYDPVMQLKPKQW